MKMIFSSSGKAVVFAGSVSANLLIDCRIIKNPFREASLAGKTGDDPEVQKWLMSNAPVTLEAMRSLIYEGLGSFKTRNSGKNAKEFRVHFFCLAGVHRSRGCKNVLATYFRNRDFDVEVI